MERQQILQKSVEARHTHKPRVLDWVVLVATAALLAALIAGAAGFDAAITLLSDPNLAP